MAIVKDELIFTAYIETFGEAFYLMLMQVHFLTSLSR